MSLRFIYGRAGYGKGYFCLQDIKKKINEGGVNSLIMLVPDQYSFQSEKNLLEAIDKDENMRASVISFKRMAHRVFTEVGGLTKQHMDDAGRAMLIFKVMAEVKDRLKVYSKAASQKGFIDTISDMIVELKRYDISPLKLKATAEIIDGNENLKNKLEDIALIYRKFENTLHEKYIDSEDDMTLLYEKLDYSKQFDGAEIYIDNFVSFTPQQLKIIEKLMKKAKRVNVTLTTDCSAAACAVDNTDVFEITKSTENKILKIAIDNNIAFDEPVNLNKNYRNRFENNPELSHIEKHLFSYPFKEYKDQVKNIQLFKAVNIHSEVEQTARSIAAIVRDENLRYGNIVVAGRSMDRYESLIEAVFSSYDIPYFIDRRRKVESNPLVVFITSALEVITKRWSYESVFRYLKSGLSGIDREDISLIENYVLANGIRGSKWNEDTWEYRLNYGFDSEETGDYEKEILKRVNAAKMRITKPLLRLYNKISKKTFTQKADDLSGVSGRTIDEDEEIYLMAFKKENTSLLQSELEDKDKQIASNGVNQEAAVHKLLVDYQNSEEIKKDKLSVKGIKTSDMCRAIFEFIDETGAGKVIETMVCEFKARGELDAANEYSQVWNIVISVLDQIVEVIGDDTVGLEDFAKMLQIGFSQYDIGLIPPSLDQVLVSDIDRMRSHDVSLLYLIGVNDGVFPSAHNDEGILNDNDREILLNIGVELSATTKVKAFQEQFVVYTTLTAPNKYLRISYPIADHEGKTLRPSIIISRIKKLLPQMTLESNILKPESEDEIMELISAPLPTFNEMIAAVRNDADGNGINKIWHQVYRWFIGQKEWKSNLERVLEGIDYSNQAKAVSKDMARKLYGTTLRFSVSRLEQYAACPFAYFIQYGLKARDRKVYELTPPDLGTFMHNVIDRFAKDLEKENMTWRDVDCGYCEQSTGIIVDEMINGITGFILSSSPRYKYMAQRLKRLLSEAIYMIARQIQMSGFDPIEYEAEFGAGAKYPALKISLPTGEEINLIGRIDRIDSKEFEEGKYIRIIDYKSGNKSLRLSDVYNGLQLQLLTYLDAVLESSQVNGGGLKPAGILYFRIDDPIIKTKGEITDEEIQIEIMKNLKMKGLLIDDPEVVREMDKTAKGQSLIVPAYIKEDGSLGSSTSAISAQGFEILRKYVRHTITKLSQDMMNGNISIKPYKRSKNTPCEYCNYQAVCQFDTAIRDNNYRIIKNTDDEEAVDLMELSISGKNETEPCSNLADNQKATAKSGREVIK